MAGADERHEEKERSCLRCRNTFMSRDAGNRICKKCTSANAAEHAPKNVPNGLLPFYKDFNGSMDEVI